MQLCYHFGRCVSICMFRYSKLKNIKLLTERLRQHTKKVHTREGNWLTCPHCDYTTRSKAHMNRHVASLHEEKNVQCSECSALFSSKENLKYHILRRHTDESQRKFYYCEMCPKDEQYKTTEKGNLVRHILAHRTLDEVIIYLHFYDRVQIILVFRLKCLLATSALT